MKDFDELNYPVTITVRVSYDTDNTWIDSIKGLNVGHALWEARQNWIDAEISFLRVGE